jgi:tripartite-type tricarboxylate transporter receptor subunit TctC
MRPAARHDRRDRRRLVAAVPVCGAATARLPTVARARAFPSRPVTVMVGTPPGGPTDVSARVMQPAPPRAPGQPSVVENVPGAAGSIGVQRMLDGPVDEYRVYLGTPSDTVLSPLSVAAARCRAEGLRRVARFSSSDDLLATHPGLRFADADARVDRVRDRAEPELDGASFGPGFINHLAMEGIRARLGR